MVDVEAMTKPDDTPLRLDIALALYLAVTVGGLIQWVIDRHHDAHGWPVIAGALCLWLLWRWTRRNSQ